MILKKVPFAEADYLRVREFLVASCGNGRGNWLIDRWNFCRYFAQPMNGTFETWPDSIGLWIDEENHIRAVVNSEGENEGEAFIQLSNGICTEDMLADFIGHAEKFLSITEDGKNALYFRVSQEDHTLGNLLRKDGYKRLDWREALSSISLEDHFDVDYPEEFQLVDGDSVSDAHKGLAHGKAFGYYQPNRKDNPDAEAAFSLLRTAPDYQASLDFMLINGQGEIASFATVWFDAVNRIGILEPVGTIPEYRRMGLGKAVISAGANAVKKLGGIKLYVGSDQPFYKAIGFSVELVKDVWGKEW